MSISFGLESILQPRNNSRRHPEVLEELKENTISNNVPEMAFAGLILVLRRAAPSPSSRVKESKDLFVAGVIIYRFWQQEKEVN